jgi:hypothetical protein
VGLLPACSAFILLEEGERTAFDVFIGARKDDELFRLNIENSRKRLPPEKSLCHAVFSPAKKRNTL